MVAQQSFRPVARSLLDIHDGDTPAIRQPIRMVSADTPEKAGYAGGPEIAQPKLDITRARLLDGYFAGLIPDQFSTYLVSKLTQKAAANHVHAGERATGEFERIVAERLSRGAGKTPRKVAVVPTGEVIDRYQRMLAYLAPWFGPDELPPRDDPRRRTFNLDMIENGWAAFFPVYPSVPQHEDFLLAQAAATAAWTEKRGAYGEFGAKLLLAYEYRLAIKLAGAGSAPKLVKAAFQRICIDTRDMSVAGKFGWGKVPPAHRLWVWLDDYTEAETELGLPPAPPEE